MKIITKNVKMLQKYVLKNILKETIAIKRQLVILKKERNKEMKVKHLKVDKTYFIYLYV